MRKWILYAPRCHSLEDTATNVAYEPRSNLNLIMWKTKLKKTVINKEGRKIKTTVLLQHINATYNKKSHRIGPEMRF